MSTKRIAHVKRSGQAFNKAAVIDADIELFARPQAYAAGRLIYSQQRPIITFRKQKPRLLVPAEDIDLVVDKLLDEGRVAVNLRPGVSTLFI